MQRQQVAVGDNPRYRRAPFKEPRSGDTLGRYRADDNRVTPIVARCPKCPADLRLFGHANLS